MNKVCISIPKCHPGNKLKLTISGSFSSLFVIIFSLIFQNYLVVVRGGGGIEEPRAVQRAADLSSQFCGVVLGHGGLLHTGDSGLFQSGCVVGEQSGCFQLGGHLSHLVLHRLNIQVHECILHYGSVTRLQKINLFQLHMAKW